MKLGIVLSYLENPNITMDIIRDNPDCPWNWEYI